MTGADGIVEVLDVDGEPLYERDWILDLATGKQVFVVAVDRERGKVLMSSGPTTRGNRVRYLRAGKEAS
jgi:hypothetical protein